MGSIQDFINDSKNDYLVRHIEVRPISKKELLVSLESDSSDNDYELQEIIQYV